MLYTCWSRQYVDNDSMYYEMPFIASTNQCWYPWILWWQIAHNHLIAPSYFPLHGRLIWFVWVGSQVHPNMIATSQLQWKGVPHKAIAWSTGSKPTFFLTGGNLGVWVKCALNINFNSLLSCAMCMKVHMSHTLRYISHLPSRSMCFEILIIAQYMLGDKSSTWVCSRNLVSCLVQRVPSAKLLHLDKSAAKTVAIKNPLEQSSLFGCVSSAVTNVNILWLWSLGELLPTPSSLQLALSLSLQM